MKTFLGSLFVALVAAAFAYQLSKKAPDVRYSLSERIPVTFATADEVPSESVQRLEIRNVGNEEARDVQVKLSARVTWFKLLKHSEKSAPIVFSNRVPFELVYPSLPPEASFVIIFRSTGSVQNAAVSVRHSAGLATEALTKTPSTWPGWIIWFIIVLNLATSAHSLLVSQRDRADSRLASKKLSEVFEAKKPIFVSRSTWKAAVKNAVMKRIDQTSDTDEALERSAATLVLNLTKPGQVDQILWGEMVASAAKTYERSLKQLPKLSWLPLESLYSLKKPSSLSETVWLEFQKEIRKRHVAEVTPHAWDHDNIRKLLRSAPIQLQGTQEGSKLHDYLQGEHARLLSERMIGTTDPLSRLDEADLSLLDQKRRAKVVTLAYDIQLTQYSKSLLWARADAVLGLAKPEWLEDADFAVIKRVAQMEKDASTARNEATQMQTAALRERAEISALKERLEWQLQTIHNVLTDPSAADRVEEYHDRFAPGNLANLKRLAQASRRDEPADRRPRSNRRSPSNPRR